MASHWLVTVLAFLLVSEVADATWGQEPWETNRHELLKINFLRDNLTEKTPEFEQCENKKGDEICEWMANGDGCYTEPNYMDEHCKKTCQGCARDMDNRQAQRVWENSHNKRITLAMPPQSVGLNCRDIEMRSDAYGYTSVVVEGSKEVRSITLNYETSRDTSCQFGRNYGADSTRIYVHSGCSGSFRVCYSPNVAQRKYNPKKLGLKCRSPFHEENGKCIIARKGPVCYVEASARCAAMGGRLLFVNQFVNYAAQINTEHLPCGGYFIGGARSFAEMAKRLNQPDWFIQLYSALNIRTNKDLLFAFNVAEKFNILDPRTMSDVLERFGNNDTSINPRSGGPLSNQCLAFIVEGEAKAKMVNCGKPMGYICEQVDEDDDDAWTPWINVDQDQDGDEKESLCSVRQALRDGRLRDVQPGDLCEHPVAMQCRIVGTNDMFSPQEDRGYDLWMPCQYNQFRCRDVDQPPNDPCPDVEIRFQCPKNPCNDCEKEMVKKNCERQGMTCEMTPYGAQCVAKPKPKKDVLIGTHKCTLNYKEYNVFECVSRGGFHYTTPDGTSFSFQGSCSYNLASTCNSYVPSADFPAFSVSTIMDQATGRKDGVSWLKGFVFKLQGISYTFTKGDFYVNTGIHNVKRNMIDYSDHQISVEVQPQRENKVIVTINTRFCLKIVIDNQFILKVLVPETYKQHICGLCGNFDGDMSNDLSLPKDKFSKRGMGNQRIDPSQYGRFHMISGPNSDECLDIVKIPKPCPKDQKDKFCKRNFCGVLNPESDSPFVIAAMDKVSGEARKRIKGALTQIYEECLLDNCIMDLSDEDRCDQLERIIEEIMLALGIYSEDLEMAWREYAKCSPEAKMCEGRENTEYSYHYSVHCQNTCQEPTKASHCYLPKDTSGCVCKQGYVLDAKMNCIREEDCISTCIVKTEEGETVSIMDGETMVVSPCKKTVTCKKGELEEKYLECCSEHAECDSSGTGCKCRVGYRGNGYQCTPMRPCREGYIAMGTKCYKIVKDQLDWHSAAINCGADGATLARFDSDVDYELESFFKLVPQLLVLSKAVSIIMQCSEDTACTIPNNRAAVNCRVEKPEMESNCRGKFEVSADRRKIYVKAGCKASFIVETIEAKEFTKTKIVTWVGGNTKVLKPRQRDGKTPFQVDPPRMMDMDSFKDEEGCFQGTINDKGQFVADPNCDCDKKMPSICEYDNAFQNIFNPLDIVIIDTPVPFEEAKDKCKAINRPLISIESQSIQDHVYALMKTHGGKVWTSATFQPAGNYYTWKNGHEVTYKNFGTDTRTFKMFKDNFCVYISEDGVWQTGECGWSFKPMCGPPENVKALVFTPFYAIDGFDCIDELKAKLRRLQRKDFICDYPVSMECSAKNKKTGQFETQETQKGKTITCRPDKITCADGGEFDCSTFRVRFLCPQVADQCKELDALKAPACYKGQQCYPVTNHYVCRCPEGSMWSKLKKECVKFGGECAAFGDPHYLTFSGQQYDFMGMCNYKLTGVCKPEEFKGKPYFDINTQNQRCDEFIQDGSCIDVVEVNLFNILFKGQDGQVSRRDFVFKYKVDGSYYQLNGHNVKEEHGVIENVFDVKVKSNYWSLVVHELDLKIFVNNRHLRVQVPECFAGKLCGLCGDLGTNTFRTRDGKYVNVPKTPDGLRWEPTVMAKLGQEWRVDGRVDKECPAPPRQDKCQDVSTMPEKVKEQCSIFLQKDCALKECFEKMGWSREQFYHACLYDLCSMKDADIAVCGMVETFVQKCASKGIPIMWRTEKFCPMQCPKGQVYRTDASCEKSCSDPPGSQGVCRDEAYEGCACPADMYRQGDSCVTFDKCGCQVYDMQGTFLRMLRPGESMIMPECTETVTCVMKKDGTLFKQHKDYCLKSHQICVDGRLECARGFRFAKDGKTCERVPSTCTRDYQDVGGMCIRVRQSKKIWRQAVESCNQDDGTLVYVDTEQKMEIISKIMKGKNLGSIYVSGRVIAKNTHGMPTFTSVLDDKEQGQVEWINFDFYKYFLNKIQMGKNINAKDIPAGGLLMSVVAVMSGSGEIELTAVESTYSAHFMCEQRQTLPSQLAWHGPCNTDYDMADDGDQEKRHRMLEDPTCMVCPVPMDVKCVTVPNSRGEEGICQNTEDGLYYSCNQGRACADKAVKTLCAKDADECRMKRDDCPVNSKCVNTVGAYKCECKESYPLMVGGQCQAAGVCAMVGPRDADEYIYWLETLYGKTGEFDFDCKKIKIAQTCNPESIQHGTPIVSFAESSIRSGGKLYPAFSGAIYDPSTKKMRTWLINPDLIKRGKILYGEKEDDMKMAFLSFSDEEIRTRFIFAPPGTLVIRSLDNHFKATMSFPSKFRLDIAAEYKKNICGICSVPIANSGQLISLSDQDFKQISFDGYETCKPRIVRKVADFKPPMMKIQPPQRPACNKKYVDFCRSLSSVCSVSRSICELDLCAGNIDICDYLSTETQMPCKTGPELDKFVCSLHCNEECGKHQEFRYGRRSTAPTCENPEGICEQESTEDDWNFSCFCKDGFLLSGNKCVRPNDCGCTTKDGSYKPVGSTWRSKDCKMVYNCREGRQIKELFSPCGKNAVCAQTQDGPQCQCNKGMGGNPNLPEGCFKGKDDGSKICCTYVNERGMKEEKCRCKEGYASKCNQCVERRGRQMCNKMPILETVKFDEVLDDLRCVGEPVVVGTCANMLCDGEGGTCCKGDSYDKVKVEVDCFSTRTKKKVKKFTHVYPSARSCSCQTPRYG